MSELEKLQRFMYQQRRNLLIMIQAIIAAVLILATLITCIACAITSKETYIRYTEKGGADYKVYLGENEFYTEKYLDSNHAYIATLIDYITADFSYNMRMDSDNVNYKYSYKIDAQVLVKDKSGAALYDPVYEIEPLRTVENNNSTISIKESVKIDYHEYDQQVRSYLEEFDLKNTNNLLVVRMTVDVLGMSESFAQDNKNSYVIDVQIPLCATTLSIQTNATVPSGEQTILVKNDKAVTLLRLLSIIFAIASVLLAGFFVCFIILTRDKHIDYARKVRKILNNYKSYIQRINNQFDSEGYQILLVDTIREMLEIRDTLQMPILMYENDDRTSILYTKWKI